MKLDSKYIIGAAAAAGIAIAAFSEVPSAAGPSQPTASPAAAQGQLPEGHPPVTGDQQAPPLSGQPVPAMAGVAAEVLQAAGYTYVRVTTEDGDRWVAGPVTDLAEGDTLSLPNVMDMGDFQSEALGRTFEPLYFTDSFLRPGEVPAGYSGTVLQAFQADRYVILEVESDTGPVWIAATASGVSEGDRVAWGEGTMMQGFYSSTLDRTFDAILFVNGIRTLPQ